MTGSPSWLGRAGQLPRMVVDALPARVVGLFRQGRTAGVRTGKTVLAAVLAYAAADWLGTSDAPVLAPLTALLVIQLTMYETFAIGWERIVSVVAGVLVAYLFALVTGLTWWSLGLVVAISLVAGRLLRLGDHLMEVPISAMLILAVGGSGTAAQGRVVETLVGAVVAVLVNLLIAPPLYVQPASEAIAELAERMARFSRSMAEAVCGEWSRETALALLAEARRLSEEVIRADRILARTEESARLNPRGRIAREARPRLRSTLTALEHVQVVLRDLARTLLDRTSVLPEPEAAAAYSPEARTALAHVLDALATALEDTGAVICRGETTEATASRIQTHLETLETWRNRLSALLLVDPQTDPEAWVQHGALLSTIDRLRVELEAALRPALDPWRPAPLAARPRQAVRQALSTAAHRPARPARPAVAGRRARQAAARLRGRRAYWDPE
ncbi:FUSC family protein [Geodermatophilus ruber]|uniref:Aromatic acid exporter family member 1 n=1 Tax=Geodermatophilus ruber TaxID=504800 RepID=A0A1I4DUI8_9ACTN|nr:aromatic acid exporter family protein [Geodermatophilus ruber]SFK97282.1 Aromatic acid exporter family member 1 [Geodermatophilus ruber]